MASIRKNQSGRKKDNFPGMRMIIACGFRVRGRRSTIEREHDKLNSILQRFRNNRLTAEQAIREASTARPSFDIVPQLQANFAFTKAYVADSTGEGSGLSGPSFYLDLSLLRRPLAAWPRIDAQIQWKHDILGLDTCFGKVRDIPKRRHADTNINCVRSGLEVAQALVADTDVLEALRRARRN